MRLCDIRCCKLSVPIYNRVLFQQMFYLFFFFRSIINTGELAFYLIQPFSLKPYPHWSYKGWNEQLYCVGDHLFLLRIDSLPFVPCDTGDWSIWMYYWTNLLSTFRWVWSMGNTIRKSKGKSKVRLSVYWPTPSHYNWWLSINQRSNPRSSSFLLPAFSASRLVSSHSSCPSS